MNTQEAGQRNETCAVAWEHLRLPPFSQVALRVLEVVHRENAQLHELSDLISSDPAFAGEVLAIVNSLAYAPRFPINSILQAIAVMGAGHLQGLCLTVGVRGYLGQSLGNPSMRALWRHNLACAAIAEQLASAGFMDRDAAYTCGVLHDVGRMGLAAVRPREYADLLCRHRGTPASMMEREREVFGKDHCEVGLELVREWKLPEDFEVIVAEHHAPPRQDGVWDMAALVNLSCRMADAAGYAAFPACTCSPFAELLEELPARERKLFYTDVESLAYEVGRKINAIELL
ncbi:MAG: HDOD domain-containing protein [Terracidiphilus sp.]